MASSYRAWKPSKASQADPTGAEHALEINAGTVRI